MTDRVEEHQRVIVNQFTKQAIPFSRMSDHSSEPFPDASFSLVVSGRSNAR